MNRTASSLAVIIVLVALTGSSGRADRRQVRPARFDHVVVVGSGTYGTALAHVLGNNLEGQVPVYLYARRTSVARQIRKHRTNPEYLGKQELSRNIRPTSQLWRAIRGHTKKLTKQELSKRKVLIVMAVPSSKMREALAALRGRLGDIPEDTVIVSATKGLDKYQEGDGPASYSKMTDLIEKALPRVKTAVLSGGGFAKDIVNGDPTMVTVAAEEKEVRDEVAGLFSNNKFEVEKSADVIGVQLAGAAKNPLALLEGILNGADASYTTQSTYQTKGAQEVRRLIVKAGGKSSTFWRSAFYGDLRITGTKGSRNFRTGVALGKGQRLDRILKKAAKEKKTVESVHALEALIGLAETLNVEVPLLQTLSRAIRSKSPFKKILEEEGNQ